MLNALTIRAPAAGGDILAGGVFAQVLDLEVRRVGVYGVNDDLIDEQLRGRQRLLAPRPGHREQDDLPESRRLLDRHRPGVLAYLGHEIPQRLGPPRVADGNPVPASAKSLAAVAPMFPAPMIPISRKSSRSPSHIGYMMLVTRPARRLPRNAHHGGPFRRFTSTQLPDIQPPWLREKQRSTKDRSREGGIRRRLRRPAAPAPEGLRLPDGGEGVPAAGVRRAVPLVGRGARRGDRARGHRRDAGRAGRARRAHPGGHRDAGGHLRGDGQPALDLDPDRPLQLQPQARRARRERAGRRGPLARLRGVSGVSGAFFVRHARGARRSSRWSTTS